MIRNAVFSDIPKLVSVLEEGHKRSRYAAYKLDKDHFRQLCFEAVRSGKMYLGVVDRGDGPIGFLMGSIEPLYIVGKVRYATDLFFIGTSGCGLDVVRLVQDFVQWAESQPNVVEIWLGVTTAIGPDWSKLGRLYQKLGFTQEGAIYQKRRKSCQVL